MALWLRDSTRRCTMNACILCHGQLDLLNHSGVCHECKLIIRNLLDTRIEERWAPAIGIADHIVSDRGRVARLLNIDHAHRYPRISADGRKHYVHHLVAQAWHGPRPDGLIVLHADDDPLNPSADNLRWGTHADNAQDAIRNGKR
jgi:hypothetical protein